MRYLIAQHGRVFATRERGAELHRRVEESLRQSTAADAFVIDFASVELISFSVADEVVGRLLSDRAAGVLGDRAIVLAGANEDVLDPIVRSLRRRGLIGAYADGDTLRLLGAPPYLQATFEAARARGDFRSSQLAADLGIGVPACNNRLKLLLEAGLLTREARSGRSGGREFIYRVAVGSPSREQDVA